MNIPVFRLIRHHSNYFDSEGRPAAGDETKESFELFLVERDRPGRHSSIESEQTASEAWWDGGARHIFLSNGTHADCRSLRSELLDEQPSDLSEKTSR